MRRSLKQPSGVTLIMVAGVLAVLAALGAGFYTVMLSQSKAASRYSDSVAAELAMRAGIADAIARMREEVFYQTEDPASSWFTVDYLNAAQKRVSFPERNPQATSTYDKYFPFTRAISNRIENNSEQYILNIADAASKINVNAGDNLGFILDNLCRVVGAPLVCADLDALQPRAWATYGAGGGLYSNAKNATDTPDKKNWDLYYLLDENHDGTDDVSGKAMPLKGDGTALYGDGFAIAAYRSRHGRFTDIVDVKKALTYRLNPTHPELETVEVEVKFNALKPYITIDSWVDTSTVCTGKFEWVNAGPQTLTFIDPDDVSTKPKQSSGACQVLIDRDKSFIADDPVNDPLNKRGSLRGCYIAIINGHGAGQYRRIATNGIDWIAIKQTQHMDVKPGPISSYMIVAREQALRENVAAPTSPSGKATLPKQDALGNLTTDPNIDYSRYPLCIHRAPVNVNTASDKVLAALFLGLDIQHGHPMAVGTDADLKATQIAWKYTDNTGSPYDPHDQFAYILRPRGLKRVPASSGKVTLNRPVPWQTADAASFGYINNYGAFDTAAFTKTSTGGAVNEAHELAYRVIMARTRTLDANGIVKTPDPDPTTADTDKNFAGYQRGPFRSWDDFYFRVVKPWDDIRSSYYVYGKTTIPHSGKPGIKNGQDKASVARMIMANFNPNTDILKFNPNIEWIDRWGRNFTDMEPVMSYTDDPPSMQPGDRWTDPLVSTTMSDNSKPIYACDVSSNSARGSVYLLPSNVPNQSQSDRNAGCYIIRNFRYRSDEMIDKTDLNRSTTEFSFDSKGIFEIQSLGRVVRGNEVLAERKAESLVKVYDVWSETTQSQFVKGTIAKGNSAPASKLGTNYAGQYSRDAVNVNQLLPLTTLPEALIPLEYRIKNGRGLPNREAVDTTEKHGRDAYGIAKSDLSVPDIVANKVMPAVYDGQIVLATNTMNFDPGGDQDTFLASFNGDLDTDTCLGNGREQAKVPHTEANDGFKYRVVDTCGLLGVMNDTLVDIDTDLPTKGPWTTNTSGWNGWSEPPKGDRPSVYRFNALSDCLKGLNKDNYWENVTLRQGDLRAEGVYLSGPGVSGNEATIKYCFGDASSDATDTESPGGAKLNFDPGSKDGVLVTMWMKTLWHHNDHHTHPLFDATNPGYSEGGTSCRACYIKKFGATVWALGWGPAYVSGNRKRTDDLYLTMEGNCMQNGKIPEQTDAYRDLDFISALHGGVNWVPNKFIWHEPVNDPNVNITDFAPRSGGHEESPMYRVQPFRWTFAGARWRYRADPGTTSGGAGHWVSSSDGTDPANKGLVTKMGRAFIGTQTNPEMPGVIESKLLGDYWSSLPNTKPSEGKGSGFTAPCDIGDTGYVNCTAKGTKVGETRIGQPGYSPESGFGVTGQPVKWKWADPAGVEDPHNKVFGINNLNQDSTTWIYHHLPEDGTYAVIDELKISKKETVLGLNDYNADRAVREQTISRYYMPPDTTYKDNCPTFTSQTMLDSVKGQGTKANNTDFITVARVTWTAFTPRFLHENILPLRSRLEYVTRNMASQTQENNSFRGPFDYDKYNEVYSARQSAVIFPYGVDRPTPYDYSPTVGVGQYIQPQYTRGIEVEVLNNGAPILGSNETAPGSSVYVSNSGTFTNPEAINRFTDKNGVPTPAAKVLPSKLRYRIRFRYPVDQLVDKGAGISSDNGPAVNPKKHFLLDTPVFDDISITYFLPPQMIYYRELSE